MRPISFILHGLLLSLIPAEISAKQRIQLNNTTIELDPSVQHIPLNPELESLRPPPPRVPKEFDIFVGSSVFRDGYRCGRTLHSMFKYATHPERLRVGLIEQIFDGDLTCLDEYCSVASVKGVCPYKDQIHVETHSAAEARGCTTARHRQQKLIQDEEFCLQVDAHSHFTQGWDELLVQDWIRADNEMAVLTTYPRRVGKDNGVKKPHSSYPHLCTMFRRKDDLVMYSAPEKVYDYHTPQLGPYWGGGLSFSKCHAEKNVPVDSHLPWLWHGEEFLRSAILWTHGYELYSPSANGSVITHNYTKNEGQRAWRSLVDEETKARETEMSNNRFRLQVGIPVKGEIDTSELDKYSFGSARTFPDYMKFIGVSFKKQVMDSSACRQLHWVPYTNASAVEEIVGGGWKMQLDHVKRLSLDNKEKVGAYANENGPLKFVDEKMTLRHSTREDGEMINVMFMAPMWFLSGVVVSAILMYGTGAYRIRGIRRLNAKTF